MKKILLGYGFSKGTTPYYLEQTLKKNVETISCGPSVKNSSPPDILLKPTDNIIPIIKETEAEILILFPEGINFIPRDLSQVQIPKIVILSDSAISFRWHQLITPLFDIVFLSQKEFIPLIKKKNPKTFWLPNACSPKIHFQPINQDRFLDIAFIGNLSDLHNPKRSLFLEKIADQFKINVFSDIWGKNMSQIYGKSKIVFNISGARDINMRSFEAMVSGSLLLTDYLPAETGFPLIFEHQKNCLVYRNLKEAGNLIQQYLKKDKERLKICQQGQKEALEKHTYQKRFERMIEIIDGEIPQKGKKLYLPENLIEKTISLSQINDKEQSTWKKIVIRLYLKLFWKKIPCLLNWVKFKILLSLFKLKKKTFSKYWIKFIKSSSIIGVTQITQTLISLIGSFALPFLLTPQSLGQFKITTSLFEGIPLDLGIKTTITKQAFQNQKKNNQKDNILPKIFLLKLTIILIMSLLTLVVFQTHEKFFTNKRLLTLSGLFLFSVNYLDLFRPLVLGLKKYSLYSLSNIIITLGRALLPIIPALHKNLPLTVLSLGIATIIGNIPNISYLIHHKLLFFSTNKKGITEVFRKECLPIYLVNLSGLLSQLVIPFLAIFFSSEAIGFYTFALAITGSISLIYSSIGQILLPEIRSLPSQRNTREMKIILFFSFICGMICLPIIYLLGRVVIVYIRPDYLLSLKLILPLLIYQNLGGLFALINIFFINEDKYFHAVIVNFVISIILFLISFLSLTTIS